MTIELIIGAAVLLLLMVVGLLVLRRARPAAPSAPAVEEPQRRRSVGPLAAAAAAAAEPAEPTLDAPMEPEPAPAPRRRVAIGLTPLDAPEANAELDEPEEEDAGPELEAAPQSEPEPAPSLAAFPAEVRLVEPVPVPPVLPAEDQPADDQPIEAAPAEDGDPPSILAQLKTKKKSGPNALSGAVEGGVSSAPMGPSQVEESVSLVLRRQVPPRDEAPRSWLGGLPMMPAHLEWPRAVSPDRIDEGEVPLHFVAQLACADFPDDLWAGLGPRTGWLLLFLNPLDSQGDDPRLFKLLHIDALGEERQPPEDIRPVVDEELADGDYQWVRSASDIPAVWRRWPIDLVAVPNEAHDDGYRISVTPKGFAATLHDGAEIAEKRALAAGEPPFSWRGALYVVDSLLRELVLPPAAALVGPALREALDRPGFVASIIPELRAREQEWLNEGEGAILFKEEPLRERERELRDRIEPLAAERQARLDRLAAFIVEHPSAAAIAKRAEADARSEAEWRRSAAERLAAIREQILSRPLDSALAGSDWEALAADLAEQRHHRWMVEWTSRNSAFPVMIEEQDRSLLDLAGPGLHGAVVELAGDYQGDPALRPLVPAALLARLEPHWRALTDNRPHRVGGYHDGLQSEPEDGPQPEVLLFQLASDDAMHWNWGDGGAYFLFIAPRELAAGRFDKAEIRLEQP